MAMPQDSLPATNAAPPEPAPDPTTAIVVRRRPGRLLAGALGRLRVLRRIVLPQAMRSIVPAAGNMLIGALKGTSIVSVPAVHDPLYSVQLVYNQTYQIIPLLTVATLWYLAVASVLAVGQYYRERYYARGHRPDGAA
ncbi:ABC-type amino acid transport system permease subunit [Kitasatospora sp. GP30]|nr:ABC-type amino acid transport system permease subunit [Kitasatospora sp. GP30]